MPPLPQDVAGELGRYATLLERALGGVREELDLVRAQIRLGNVEAQLLPQLSVDERAALQPFMQNLDLADLGRRRDLLSTQRDALAHAIELVKARLNG